LKFITDEGVDVYAFILEIRDILGLPPFEPLDTIRTGVGLYGLIDDVYAVLPLEDLKVFFDMKIKTREYFKILVTSLKTTVTTIRSPVIVVSIHCIYLNFVS
jgi:hypothetical protein